MQNTSDYLMTHTQNSYIAFLAVIVFARMLGLFILLPVFSVAGQSLEGATWPLIGLAIGIYGLFQAFLQLPFGFISDRIGRKKVVIFGLVLFALGGVIAGLSEGIWGVIIGRAIQGAGAVSSAILAWAADLTEPKKRSKTMAILGMVIGLAFAMAMFLGPLLIESIGLSGIFYVTTALAVIGLLLTLFIPENQVLSKAEVRFEHFKQALFGELSRYNFSVFVLHFVMTGLFLILPAVLVDSGLPDLTVHAWVYLAVMLLSFLLMLPLMIYAEKRKRVVAIIQLGIAILAAGLLLLQLYDKSLYFLFAGLLIYFVAFNLLEALMPSWISRLAEQQNTKGASLGAYSASQFIGAFMGSVIGGIILRSNDFNYWVWALIAITIAWYFAMRAWSIKDFNS